MHLVSDIAGGNFLFWDALWVCLLVGAVCPLFGLFLVVRRMVFLGVALPHISSAGIALALSLHVWLGYFDSAHGADSRVVAMAGAVAFVLLATFGLAWAENRDRGGAEGRIGTVYIVAVAGSLLLLSKCPQAERGWLSLFKGEIIAVSRGDLWLALGSFAVLSAALLTFRKEFLLTSYDRDFALSLRKRVFLWDTWLYLLIGLCISVSVFVVGPLITFGFMLLPPLIVRSFVPSMRLLGITASVTGILGAVAGFLVAYEWDFPIGPSCVAVLGAAYLPISMVQAWLHRRHPAE